MFESIRRFVLGIAARKGWNLSPKAAPWVLVDDYGVVLKGSVFS